MSSSESDGEDIITHANQVRLIHQIHLLQITFNHCHSFIPQTGSDVENGPTPEDSDATEGNP